MTNILVTGASKGIGKVIAESLFDYGDVYITSRSENLLKQVKSKDYLVCNLEDDISELIKFIEKNKIDVLINNAGQYIYKDTEKLSPDDIKKLLRVNLEVPILLSSACSSHMKSQNWGRIINIGSISGVMGEACACVYSATKAGLIGLSKSLGLELAPYGITVNTINPGWVETELGIKSIEDSDFSIEETLQIIPQKRFVAPQEIADLVKFLISDSAKGITGQSINVCAGLSVGI